MYKKYLPGSGWIAAEVGRQPWIVQGVLKVSDAVTDAGGLVWSLAAIVVVYLILGAITVTVLRRMARRLDVGEDAPAPYGPEPAVVA